MSLINLQATFIRQITQDETDDQSNIFPADSSYNTNNTSSGELNTTQRIDIYREVYQLRLIEALMDNFPAVHTLLGDDDFEDISRQYIHAYPSQHFSLRYFGEHLSKFFSDHSTFSSIEILAEMAEFEWQLRFAFDAKNAVPIKIENIAGIDPEQWQNLVFTLIPSFTKITLNWNTVSLWKAAIQEAPPQAPEPLSETEQWIIWRPELETLFRSISTLESNTLNHLRFAHNFGEICEFMALETGAGAELQSAELLSQWLNEGLIASFTV